jgi:carboxypeptidase C (cathepsin A)
MTDTAANATTDKSSTDDEKKRQRERVERLLLRAPSQSTGYVSVGGKKLEYAATAGFVPIVAQMSDTHKGEPDAALFVTSYTLQRKGVAAKAPERPILFAFNGGRAPRRSGCIWAH